MRIKGNKNTESYKKAHRISKKLYNRLSSYSHTFNIKRNLYILIKDIIFKYKIRIALPDKDNVYECISTAEWLLESDELKNKLGKDIKPGESPIELKLALYLDEEGIKYIREKKISRYRVDFLIPDRDLVIECDGYAWHKGPQTYNDMEKTLKRSNAIALAGYKLLRYSGRQIYSKRDKIIEEIKSIGRVDE